MSDEIGHHCGIALVRLKKPLSHYSEKYDTALWGFNQLFLLMEKQHNRGQDGAGIFPRVFSVMCRTPRTVPIMDLWNNSAWSGERKSSGV